MAINTATLTVTISEALSFTDGVNSRDFGGINTLVVNNINDVYKRIITVPITELLLYKTDATLLAGAQLDANLIKYARVTNKSSTEFVELRIRNNATTPDEFLYKLNAGESFLLYSHDESMHAIDGGTGSSASFANVLEVKAKADTNPVDIEVLVVSI